MSLPNTKEKYFYELKCQMCNYIPRSRRMCNNAKNVQMCKMTIFE